MPSSIKIDFKPGIKKISNVVHPSMSLTSGALQVLSRIIGNFNETLVTRCIRKLKSNSKNGLMQITVAANAVKEVCSGNIRALAVAEGNKWLLKFNCDLLHYNPKDKKTVSIKRKEKVMEKARKQQMGNEFLKGVSNLTRITFPNASLNSNAKQVICRMLADLSRKICDSARASGEAQKMITVQEVRTAVESIIQGNMCRHALAEGAKMIFFYESGRISFTPTKKRIKRHSEKLTTEKTTTVRRPKIRKVIRKVKSPTAKVKKSSKRISKLKKSPKRQTVTTTRRKRISPARTVLKRKSKRARSASSRQKRARKRISLVEKSSKRRGVSRPKECVPSLRQKIISVRSRPSRKIISKRRKRTPSPKPKRGRKKVSLAVKPLKRRVISKRRARTPSPGPKRGRKKISVETKISKRKGAFKRTEPQKAKTISLKAKPLKRRRISERRPRTPSPRLKRSRTKILLETIPSKRKRISKSAVRIPSPKTKRVSLKVQTSKRRSISKRRARISIAVKDRTKISPVSKRPKRRGLSKRRARTPSPTPKRPRTNISLEDKPPKRRGISKRRERSRSRRGLKKVSPARKSIKKSTYRRRKRTPSPIPKVKRKKISLAKKSVKPSKELKKRKTVSKKKIKTSKIMKKVKTTAKTVVQRPRKPRIKKEGGVSSKIFEGGVKSLNIAFSQSLSSDALRLICTSLATLTMRLVNEIKPSSSTINVREIREAILIVFPTGLKELALARLGQVTLSMQI